MPKTVLGTRKKEKTLNLTIWLRVDHYSIWLSYFLPNRLAFNRVGLAFNNFNFGEPKRIPYPISLVNEFGNFVLKNILLKTLKGIKKRISKFLAKSIAHEKHWRK